MKKYCGMSLTLWNKNCDPPICCLQETHFKYNDISRFNKKR